MKKDQADEFEQELLQPLAKALRTTLGDAGQVHVNNEPHLMTGRWRPESGVNRPAEVLASVSDATRWR